MFCAQNVPRTLKILIVLQFCFVPALVSCTSEEMFSSIKHVHILLQWEQVTTVSRYLLSFLGICLIHGDNANYTAFFPSTRYFFPPHVLPP